MKAVFLTQQAEIKYIKQKFTEALCDALNLTEIQAPMLTDPTQGIQDTLSGYERAVQVPVKALQQQFEVVHSLAKWKRATLGHYGFEPGEGIVTHMKALRADEETLSPVHSVYVDQWDWELIIADRHRTEAQLHTTVRSIYTALKQTLEQYKEGFGSSLSLPETITFVRSEDLLKAYPELTPKEREHAAAEEHGAIFLQGIGGALSDGTIHDVRAPDYDDWTLNGDIIVWNPVLGESLELSSMGIRVDRAALLKQLQSSGRASAEGLPWHQKLIAGQLPQTIGGGIGQSRLCMWMMQKTHIGYVQHGVWCPETRTKYADLL